MALRESTAALADAQAAVQVAPRWGKAHARVGAAQAAKGERATAAAAFREALALAEPSGADARHARSHYVSNLFDLFGGLAVARQLKQGESPLPEDIVAIVGEGAAEAFLEATRFNDHAVACAGGLLLTMLAAAPEQRPAFFQPGGALEALLALPARAKALAPSGGVHYSPVLDDKMRLWVDAPYRRHSPRLLGMIALSHLTDNAAPEVIGAVAGSEGALAVLTAVAADPLGEGSGGGGSGGGGGVGEESASSLKVSEACAVVAQRLLERCDGALAARAETCGLMGSLERFVAPPPPMPEAALQAFQAEAALAQQKAMDAQAKGRRAPDPPTPPDSLARAIAHRNRCAGALGAMCGVLAASPERCAERLGAGAPLLEAAAAVLVAAQPTDAALGPALRALQLAARGGERGKAALRALAVAPGVREALQRLTKVGGARGGARGGVVAGLAPVLPHVRADAKALLAKLDRAAAQVQPDDAAAAHAAERLQMTHLIAG